MISWQARPVEVANLLNPAFCGIIIQEFVKEYNNQTSTGVPFELIVLVLPIILHKSTRELLPLRSSTMMHVWLQKQPEVRVGFSQRTKELIPFSKESISFLLAREILTLDMNSNFFRTKRRNSKAIAELPSELTVYIQKARLIAKWFAQNTSSSTIYTMWGIRP
ncbi:three component ABC system middle component [Brevibacillus centrosporus]|uniref:three component ABC system middle component n=1 Tax=Brevibacillus centrosporus TaxID=54910 RepID=UPI003D2335EA